MKNTKAKVYPTPKLINILSTNKLAEVHLDLSLKEWMMKLKILSP